MSRRVRYPGLDIDDVSGRVRHITGIATSITAFIGRALRGPVNEPISIQGFGDYTSRFGGLARQSPMSYAVRHFFDAGGSDALIVRVANGEDGGSITDAEIATAPMLKDKREGLWALDRTDLFNLLCIPPYSFDGGDVHPVTWEAARVYCRSRRAMLIMDPPASWIDHADAVDGVDDLRGTDDDYAALYFPRIRMPDPLQGNRLETFPPCGTIAGVVARTDAQRGVWKAPAGIDAALTGVVELACNVTDDQNGLINRLGVNALRKMPAAGCVVWGARTLAGTDDLRSEWKYIPVRRLALFLDESIHRGTEWAAFAPNGEPLWAQIRGAIGTFMHELFRQGAFQGATPDEAYFVKCDSETTTRQDIEQGIVNAVVGFAPVKPAEFVMIRIHQSAGAAPT